ncbi:MAG: hypothetical protein WD294_17000 [Phycisphaeraceae bacterium]
MSACMLPVPWLPTPIDAIVTRLDGAGRSALPKAVAGMKYGAAKVAVALLRIERRVKLLDIMNYRENGVSVKTGRN